MPAWHDHRSTKQLKGLQRFRVKEKEAVDTEILSGCEKRVCGMGKKDARVSD